MKKKVSGIQRKYLKFTIALLILALLLSCGGVWLYVRKNLTGAIVDKYEFMDEKMGMALDNLFQKSDEVTGDCIVYSDVQKSLRAQGLEDVEQKALSKYFAYIDLENVSEYCYVDNKENVYSRSYSKISYDDFKKSGFSDFLGDEYARTKWFWTKDSLFGTGEPALFIGRYARSMDYAHEPGMLFLKMDADFFEGIIGTDQALTKEIAVGIMDADGQMCTSWFPDGYKLSDEAGETLKNLAAGNDAGMLIGGERIQGGALSAYRQGDSGLIVFTMVPDRVLNSSLSRLFFVLLGLYLLVAAAAVILSIYFSKRFTKPIQDINEAMTAFDGNDFTRTIELHTNTELDEIGNSYNEMLGNIERLLIEIKEQEKELRTSELNMLISQINPHFLYNTLDTIYMLARINKEETTMKMIQALSKYLRLCLSKGSDMVTVADELENVKSYMEIQQIRNENLFDYEIDCQVEPGQTWVLKLILQPLVENAVKYGFCNVFEGGLIQIKVAEEGGNLIFSVYNNGKPMEPDMAERINSWNKKPLLGIKESFPDKRHGYGVINIITRLRLKYGEDVQFSYESEKDGTRCIIKLPGDGKENDEL